MTIDKDRLRKLADGASRGPWTASGGYVSADSGRDGISGYSTRADAEFIAAARQAVPMLLDQLDAAEARIAEEKRLRMKAIEAATEAEARIHAVREVLDRAEQRHDNAVLFNGANLPAICSAPDIRQALEGDT